LASRPKFEGNNLRSKDPSYITAPRSTPGPHPQNSNREPKLLETGLTLTKQSRATHSNREKTRVSQMPFLPPLPPSTPRCVIHLAAAPKTGAPKNAPKRRKTQQGLPPVLLRLNTYPALCFVQVRPNFNRTLLRLNTSSKRIKIERRNDQAARIKAREIPHPGRRVRDDSNGKGERQYAQRSRTEPEV
jgi:hypothetical protein